MRDNKGLIYSSALHGVILLFLLFGLPDFFRRDTNLEPQAISVEILPIAPMSNVPTKEVAPPKEKIQEETAPKSRPETHAKEEVKEEQIPIPVKAKEVVKEKPKKQPVKPKKAEEDPLKKIFEGIEKNAAKEGPKKEKSATETAKKPSKSTHYDPGAPLSMSEKDAIRQQIENNWNAPVGAKDAANLKVLLHIELAQDGSVIKTEFTGDKGRYNSDSFFRAAVDSAIRAVERSSPLKNLPPEKYNVRDGWREMEINFDPKDLL